MDFCISAPGGHRDLPQDDRWYLSLMAFVSFSISSISSLTNLKFLSGIWCSRNSFPGTQVINNSYSFPLKAIYRQDGFQWNLLLLLLILWFIMTQWWVKVEFGRINIWLMAERFICIVVGINTNWTNTNELRRVSSYQFVRVSCSVFSYFHAPEMIAGTAL